MAQQLEVQQPRADQGRPARGDAGSGEVPQQRVPGVGQQRRVGREEQHPPDAGVVHHARPLPQHPDPLGRDEPGDQPAVQRRERGAEPVRVGAGRAERFGEIVGRQPGGSTGALTLGQRSDVSVIEILVADDGRQRVGPRPGSLAVAAELGVGAVEPQRRRDRRRVGLGAQVGHRRRVERADRTAQRGHEVRDLGEDQREVGRSRAGERRGGAHRPRDRDRDRAARPGPGAAARAPPPLRPRWCPAPYAASAMPSAVVASVVAVAIRF
ncbi:MAG: hypothetical protein ACO3RG_04355, partial [Nitriliruptoraceae bacterium]